MKRSLLVTFVGVVVTVLLISVGMAALLSQNTDWRAIITSRPSINEPFGAWLKHLDRLIPTAVGLVCVPTALLVGFLVGAFSTQHKISGAVIASSPAWAPLLFITFRSALIGFLVAAAAVLGAWLSMRMWRAGLLQRVR